MSFQGDEQTAAILSAIQNFGVTALYRSRINHTAGPNPIRTTVELSLSCVLQGYSQRSIDGQLIKHGDRRALIAKSSLGEVIPRLTDEIQLEGNRWVVHNIREYMGVDGTVVAFSMQVRR